MSTGYAVVKWLVRSRNAWPLRFPRIQERFRVRRSAQYTTAPKITNTPMMIADTSIDSKGIGFLPVFPEETMSRDLDRVFELHQCQPVEAAVAALTRTAEGGIVRK